MRLQFYNQFDICIYLFEQAEHLSFRSGRISSELHQIDNPIYAAAVFLRARQSSAILKQDVHQISILGPYYKDHPSMSTKPGIGIFILSPFYIRERTINTMSRGCIKPAII
jgi:hypothetical protein